MNAGPEASEPTPLRAVRVEAPVRVADVGGWTDTWFGSPGRVCHIAAGPGVAVEARLLADVPPNQVHLRAPDIGLDCTVEPDPEAGWTKPRTLADPLLAHAIGSAAVGRTDAPNPARQIGSVSVEVTSAVPPGASLGTSAAVVVALGAAIDAVLTGEDAEPGPLARRAHRVETDLAGREAGVQDQWAAAHGGAALLTISPYPDVSRRALAVPAATRTELDERVLTVVFGRHDSSEVHGRVIHDVLTCDGPGHDRTRRALRELSVLAGEAADALEAGDLVAWAAVLTRSVDVQTDLHPGLAGVHHLRAIEIAQRCGAIGWKVNGAGGEGGSLTVLAADGSSRRLLARSLASTDPSWKVLDLRHCAAGATTTFIRR